MSAEECETVQENLKVILDSVVTASRDVQRECQLVAVSKTKPSAMIQACYEAGQRHFGENYVQELEEKSRELSSLDGIRWHFIGQIQSNKIGKIAASPNLYCVETIDSEKKATMLSQEMRKHARQVIVYVQVNTSGEEQKGGLSSDDAINLSQFISDNCPGLVFGGFMTIGSFDNSHMERNPDFDVLFNARQKWAEVTGKHQNSVALSMGMSDDYLTAIAQGSTSVRVGSKIFGPRLYKQK